MTQYLALTDFLYLSKNTLIFVQKIVKAKYPNASFDI